jgi:signal peptidase
MVPVFAPGDALVIRTSVKTYSVGQIVSYRSHRDPRQIVSHRIVAIDSKQQQLITKGDNLTDPDPPIRNWDVLGTASYIVPKAGYVLGFMYTWWGLICVIYVPAFLVLGLEVRRLCTKPNANYCLGSNQKRVIVTAHWQ